MYCRRENSMSMNELTVQVIKLMTAQYTEQNDQFCFWLLPVLESEPDHNLHSCRWSSSSFSSGTLTEIPQLLV